MAGAECNLVSAYDPSCAAVVSDDDDAFPERAVDAVLRRLARASHFRDEETAEHVERVSRACALIAYALGWDRRSCAELRAASALHDLGKIGVPDALLRKPGPLSSSERALIQRHPEIGHEILAGPDDRVFALAANIALTHHEHVDGTGYPRSLRGSDIPLEGRITSVADVFDALTHDRVYRPAFTVNRALALLHEGRGTRFDARVLDAFALVLPGILRIFRRYPDAPEGDAGNSLGPLVDG